MTPGTLVRVHFNLHKLTWSVRTRVPGKGWRVSGNVDSIRLRDARPVCGSCVRIRQKGVRAVVACIEGTVVADGASDGMRRLHFNPFRSDTFHLDRERPEATRWDGGSEVQFMPTLPGAAKGTGARCFTSA
jgi:hypothetical protein